MRVELPDLPDVIDGTYVFWGSWAANPVREQCEMCGADGQLLLWAPGTVRADGGGVIDPDVAVAVDDQGHLVGQCCSCGVEHAASWYQMGAVDVDGEWVTRYQSNWCMACNECVIYEIVVPKKHQPYLEQVAELARHPHVDLPTVAASTIVAVAELRDVCDKATRGEPCRCGQWARPALRHWRWGRKWVLPTPVVEVGRLGLWRPSETTVDLVRQALAALLIVPLLCTGRQFDLRTARPVDGPAGQPCGKTLPTVPNETRARYEERARVSGWRLGPVRDDNTRDVICATCAKPDPITAALCRALMNGSP